MKQPTDQRDDAGAATIGVVPALSRDPACPGRRRLAAVALLAVPTLLASGGCSLFWNRPTTLPMPTVSDLLPLAPAGRTLIVLIPGAYSTAEDFARYGLVAAVRRRDLPVDLIAVDAHRGYFDEGSLLDRLRADVIRPARANGYARIWLVGISLGGLGAMLYEAAQQGTRFAQAEVPTLVDSPDAQRDRIDGIVAIAPYVGTRQALDEVRAAGGLAAWQQTPSEPQDWERRLFAWLRQRQYGPSPAQRSALGRDVPLIFAWGAQDRFREGIEMVTAGIPESYRIVRPGRHDWPVWLELWDAVLERFGATIANTSLSRPTAASTTAPSR